MSMYWFLYQVGRLIVVDAAMSLYWFVYQVGKLIGVYWAVLIAGISLCNNADEEKAIPALIDVPCV